MEKKYGDFIECFIAETHDDNQYNETTKQSLKYIEDVSNYLFYVNSNKYGFVINSGKLEYFTRNGIKSTTNLYKIINLLSEFICDDYYYKINMPTVDNPVFLNEQQGKNREKRRFHGSVHVYGVAIFVLELLDKLQFNLELTIEDKIIAIICALMHDSCRKGEQKDYWDRDSAVLAIKLLKIFGIKDESYLIEIMKYVGEKDIWDKKIKEEEIAINENDTIKINKAKIISTLVDLGDTEEISRVKNGFDLDFFFRKMEKINIFFQNKLDENLKIKLTKLLARYHFVLANTAGIYGSIINCDNELLKQIYYDEVFKISGNDKIVSRGYNQALKLSDIILNRMEVAQRYPILFEKDSCYEFIEYQKMSMNSWLKQSLFNEFNSEKNLNTNSIEYIYELRNENIYYLLNNLKLINYIVVTKELNDNSKINDKIKYIFKKIEINNNKYTIIETHYLDRFVDLENTLHYVEYNICNVINIDEVIEISDIDNLKLKYKISVQDIKEFFKISSKEIIGKEKDFQIQRVKNRVFPFVEHLFYDDEIKLVENVKDNLLRSVSILFDNNSILDEKFKAKEQLSGLLRLIKTAYKRHRNFTNFYIMLNEICESKTKEELNLALHNLFIIKCLYTYYLGRVKDNPFITSDIKINKFNCDFINQNIFRAISINDNINIEQIFKKTSHPDIKLFDFYHTIGTKYDDKKPYISEKKYIYRKRGQYSETRGNITSFSINAESCIHNYIYGGAGTAMIRDNALLIVGRVSKDYSEIFGKVNGAADKSSGHEYEVNIANMDISDVAFGIKFCNSKITDVVFNRNFSGDFYYNHKHISEDELKVIILNTKELGKFLNNELKIYRLIEKKNVGILKPIKQEFIEIINNNINNLQVLEKINELLYVYNIEKDDTIKEYILNELLNNFEYNIDIIDKFILDKYIEFKNTDKLIENYIEYINDSIYNISMINNIILQKESNNISLLIKLFNIQIKTNKIDIETFKLIVNNSFCNDDILLKILNNLKNNEILLSNNIVNIGNRCYNSIIETIINIIHNKKKLFYEILENVNINIILKNTNIAIFKFINEDKRYNSLLELIINENNNYITGHSGTMFPKQFIDNLTVNMLFRTMRIRNLEANYVVYNSIMEMLFNSNILYSGYCPIISIINKFSEIDLFKKINSKIVVYNQNSNNIKYNSFFEALVDNCCLHYFNKQEFLELIESKVSNDKLNEFVKNNFAKIIIPNKQIVSILFEKIFEVFSLDEIFEPKNIIINKKQYGCMFDVIINSKKISRDESHFIIQWLHKYNILEKSGVPLTINNILCKNVALIEIIINIKNCDNVVMSHIIDCFSKKEIFNKFFKLNDEKKSLFEIALLKNCHNKLFDKFIDDVVNNYNKNKNIIEMILSDKQCSSYLIKDMFIKLKDFLQKDYENSDSIIHKMINHNNFNYNATEVIVESFGDNIFKPINISCSENSFNTLFEEILNSKDAIGLEYIIRKFDMNTLLKPLDKSIIIDDKEHNCILTAIMDKYDVFSVILNKFGQNNLLKSLDAKIKVDNIEYNSILEAYLNSNKVGKNVDNYNYDLSNFLIKLGCYNYSRKNILNNIRNNVIRIKVLCDSKIDIYFESKFKFDDALRDIDSVMCLHNYLLSKK